MVLGRPHQPGRAMLHQLTPVSLERFVGPVSPHLTAQRQNRCTSQKPAQAAKWLRRCLDWHREWHGFECHVGNANVEDDTSSR